MALLKKMTTETITSKLLTVETLLKETSLSLNAMIHPEAEAAPTEPTPELPASTETAETPEVPEAVETAETPEVPEAVETEETPEVPEAVETEETPEVPEAVETEKAPEVPEAVETAGTPEVPEAVETVETPEVPEAVETAETPETPEVPEAVETEETPEVPEAVETVETPEVPETVETEEAPEVPEEPTNIVMRSSLLHRMPALEAVVEEVKETPEEPVETPEEPAETPEEPAEAGSAIHRFLQKAGLVVVEEHVPKQIGGLDFLVQNLGKNIHLTHGFLKAMRTATCNTARGFCYDLNACNPQERDAIIKLADMFCTCGVYTEFTRMGTRLHGKLSASPHVINFINGEWLELYCQGATAKTIKAFADDRGLPTEMLANVKIIDMEGNMHEIDMLFSIGDMVFGTEQKTGQTLDYDKYRRIGEWMGVVPDRFILLNSSITIPQAFDCLQYFYSYYVSNIPSYTNTLTKMIRNAFEA